MLANFVDTIAPNVSPLQGNSIVDDERVSFGMVAATTIGNHVKAADWSDSIIERCRFDNTTISDSGFERVAILDCDLSGVSFSNCLLRECLIIGVKAKYHLVFDNCILDRVIVTRSRIDRFDVHNSSIVELEFLGIESALLDFHECRPKKRTGQVSFEDCEIARVSGLEEMGKRGISVHVDAPMWRDLGDYFLRERGIKPLEGTSAQKYGLLDEIGDGLVRHKS